MSEIERDLRILEVLESNPELTQAGLAAQLGVAVGSVNWYLKRLIRKGYIKVTRLQRRRLRYLVTPQGLARKSHLALEYMKASLHVYCDLRQSAREALERVRAAGYTAVQLVAQDEAAEIFRLTGLEVGVRVEETPPSALPVVRIAGMQFIVEWPERTTEPLPGGRADD